MDEVVREVDVNGTRLSYGVQGEGGPLLLLHGGLGSRRDFDWLLPRLPEGWRAFAVDQRGHGGSRPFGSAGNPWAGFTLDTLTEDALALLDVLAEGKRWAVLGHSLGGAVAQRLAAEAPGRVSHLVVLASPPVPGEAFRAHFAKRLSGYAGEDELTRRSLEMFSRLDESDLPEGALKAFKGPALIVEPLEDPLYSPVQTMMWRGFLPEAGILHPGFDHDFHKREAGARWLAERLEAFLREKKME